MTAHQNSSARFRLAPVAAGGAVWTDSIDMVLAPIHLSKPVHVVLPGSPREAGR